MKRLLLFGLVLALLFGTTLVAGAITPPQITITRVEPPVPAVRGGGTSLELRDPAEELVLLDRDGQPWLRMDASGVTRKDTTGLWAEVRTENFYYLTETEVGRFVTNETALPYPFQMLGTYGGRPFTITGTYVPPGSGQKSNTSGMWTGVVLLVGLALVAVAIIGGLIYGIVVLVQRKSH